MSTPTDAEVLYGNNTELYIKDGLSTIASYGQEQLASAEQIAADQAQLRDVATRYGVTGDMATGFADALNESRSGKVDAARVAEWEQASRAQMVSQYGAANASQVLADTQRLIAGDKKLSAHLKATGLGNHPKVVGALARSAYEARRNGKLK